MINKSGYLYIYVSNETPNIDVFFDQLQVTHIKGNFISEDHYYPYGERMFNLSSERTAALTNKKKYNGIDFENDLDLNVSDAQFRELDAQTGRWWQIDPKTDEMYMWSTYASNFDNPIRYADPKGDEPDCCPLTLELLQATEQAAASNGPILSKPIVLGGLIAAAFVGLFELIAESGETPGNVSMTGIPSSMNTITWAEDKAQGTNIPKVKESIKTGQEAHRQEQAKLKEKGATIEVPMKLKDGTSIRKDAVKKDGTPVIIKPDTKTGRASAAKREKLLKDNEVKKPEKILYDPKDPKYQPGSPTYIGPKL